MNKLKKEAKIFIKKNKNLLIEKFANLNNFKPQSKPVSIFMAGSPCAGKTETSKLFLNILEKKFERKFIRIDIDEIREIIPQYNGKNSNIIQGACAIGVEKLYDHVLKHELDVVVDGTFANLRISQKNIERSINKNRIVNIFYVYQSPKIAWELTKKREALDGRFVPKKVFVDSFLNSRYNVNRMKEVYKGRIRLILLKKNYSYSSGRTYFDIDNVDKYIRQDYTKTYLNKTLRRQKYEKN